MRDAEMDADLRGLRMAIMTTTTRMAVAMSLGDADDFVDELDALAAVIAKLKSKYAERKKKADKDKRFK